MYKKEIIELLMLLICIFSMCSVLIILLFKNFFLYKNKNFVCKDILEVFFFLFLCQVGEFLDELKEFFKRVLLVSAFIIYLVQVFEDVRRNFMNIWFEVLGVQYFDCRRFFSIESEQLIWKFEGLSLDELFMENVLVILQVNYMYIFICRFIF